jgi:hypothetical protein
VPRVGHSAKAITRSQDGLQISRLVTIEEMKNLEQSDNETEEQGAGGGFTHLNSCGVTQALQS